ncbi:MAG: aldolase [Armatimonadetes bacterium]|nr:aldolase [Armatimonadota bacterium]NIO76449.1 aldolase [Armatimonadota bacterium]NIO96897.1 aldolase [Armatimonadota bacterium]
MWEELSRFGKKLVAAGLVHSHFGNMSLRVANKILITRSGSMLDELDENQVVEVDLNNPTSFDINASVETIVHRAIYQKTSSLAVIHCHSPFAVTLSMLAEEDKLVLTNSEGLHLLHEIPLIEAPSGSAELAEKAAAALSDHKACIIRGHGPIATGKIVEEAFVNICSVEHVCKVKYYIDLGRQTLG